MSDSLYPRDLTVRVRLRQRTVNSTTGAWETTGITGRTNGLVWFSFTRDGARISADTERPLVAVGATDYYTATFDGPTLAAALSAVKSGTPLWEVIQFGTDDPSVRLWSWRPTRAEL